MRCRTSQLRLATSALLLFLHGVAPSEIAAQQPCGGPLILAGHDADDHGFEAIYAGLFDAIYANTTNGGFGILSIGSDFPSDASDWIDDVASLMAVPQAVIHINDAAISTQSFTGFAILHIPSDIDDTNGGISLTENALFALRAADIAAFVNAGGGLFGLTQGNFANAWEYMGVVAPVTYISRQYDDITSTPAGQALGIQDTNLDGCCFHNVFSSFPAYFDVLAIANEPSDPIIDGLASFVGGIQTCVLPFCGDGKLDPGEECDDGNTLDGDGCSSTCQIECVPIDRPPVIVCSPCERCNSPLRCDADVACAEIATALDPEGAPLAVTCDLAGPFPVGTTGVLVRASDGLTEVEQMCTVVVNDCEPPICAPPANLELECNDHCGVSASDPDISTWVAGATAMDNCPGVTMQAFPPPVFASGCAPGASTRVGFLATDALGFERTCSAAITVKDTAAPLVVGCALKLAVPLAPASPSSPASASVPMPPKPPRPPASPTSPTSDCVGPSSGLITIDCGIATDGCDAAPTVEAKLVVTRYEVDATGCVVVMEEIPVDCCELIEIRRLAAPCPAKPPRSPSSVSTPGHRVIEGQEIRLEVRATDQCGLVSATCTADVSDPLPCKPAEPKCEVPLCGS